MRKVYIKFFVAIFSLTIMLNVLPGCSHKNESGYEKGEGEEDHDEYDNPGAASEFEYRRNIDPATGRVPHERMWQAVLETEALKNVTPNSSSSSTALPPLTWVERGSNTDAVGPSNGNSRPGNGVTSGRMKAVWVDIADPTGNTVWVGGVWGGIWKTTNINATTPTWTLANDYLSNLVVTGICQDPTNPNTMYMATGETGLLASYSIVGIIRGDGVFKSIDHGVTWTQLPSTTDLTNCTKILCDATGNVYVSSVGISIPLGLQRSTNGGTSWVSINPFSTTSRVVDFEISSLGAMHVVGGLSSGAGVGGYSYTANPATVTTTTGWNTATTPYTIPTGNGARVEIVTSGNTIYAAISNANKIDNIGKSTDGGVSWTTTPLTPANVTALNGGGQGSFSNTIGIDPSDPNTVIVGSLNLLKSIDGGATFSKISEWVGTTGQYCHADQHAIVWYENGNKLMIGTDGGLFYSTNKGVNISDKNTGLRLKQFYGVTAHPTLPNYFLCGAQDNGTHQFNNPGLSNSIEVLGGDGGITGIDQDEPQFQSATFIYANFRRSSNGGATWVSNGSTSTAGLFINPYDYDNLANKIYASNNAGQFLRWENPHSGFTFNSVTIADFAAGTISSVTSSALTANRVYFGLTNGRVIKVDNADIAAPTSTIITPTAMPAAAYVTCVAEASVNTQNLIATVANYGVTNVYSTTDGGTTWAACDGNLPDMPVYWAVYHPDADTKAYIATETGVWSTDLLNGASTIWTPEPTFPTVKTSMLKYRSGDRTLAAATYGRGLWTATIPNSCVPASITTQPINVSICAGANTSFSITAGGTPTLTYQWQVSTAGAGGPWTNLTNTAPYSNVTTATVNITGATTALNTYQYRVIVTGNCAPLTATSNPAVLTVNAATTLTLTSAAATTSQTVNINTAITNITYTTGNGVTGATVTGLPAGVTGVYSGGTNGTITLSGTPTVAGTFTYAVTTSGGCGAQTATGTITVVSAPALTLTSAAGTSNQTVCINNPITNIVYSSAGGVTGATVTGLPAGITGAYNAGIFTISGTPTVTGTFSYTVTSSGGTPNATATGTITINAATTLTLTSAAGTTSQTVTVNSAITNITYNTANGVTGATVTSLPAGVTGAYSGGINGTITISGTPTAAGAFSYTVTTTGGCGVQTATGSITAVNGPSIALTSAAGTNNQTVCINSAITNIVYTAAGGVTGATVTGLPTGVTGTYSGGTNGTFTVAGTPTVTGTFAYTVTTSGGTSVATATGTITVNAVVTLTLTSAAATTTQTVNINTAITNITYSSTGGITGATVTGLPAGVTGVYSGGTNGTVTISGTPTAAGTFNYTVTTSGGCGTQTRTGTITVVIPPSITLTSPAGSNTQTICIGNPITTINYSSAGGVTGASASGLPPGVTGTYTGGTNGTYSISGTPTATGTFNYIVTTTGGVATATGSITVNALPTAPVVNTVPPYCQGSVAAPLSATGTGLLWYNTATGGTGSATTPTPLTVSAGSTTYFVSQTINGCEGPRASIVVTVNATPTAPTAISQIPYCQGATATALTATGANLLWYTVATGGTGATAAPIPNTAAAGTTLYYVSQTTSGCESNRTAIVVNVTALPLAPTVVSPVSYCQLTTATALTASGTGLVWYTTATGGSGTATAPTPNTILPGTVTYYVAQTNSCGEGVRAAIVVNTIATPLAVTNLNTTNITETSAVLNWTGSTGSFYTVEYKISTASTWTTAATGITANTFNVTNLTRGAAYSWRVFSNCTAIGGGNVSIIATFNTSSRNSTITNIKKGFGLKLTPNPIQSSGVLDYLVPGNGTVGITVIDANGQIIRNLFNSNQNAGQYVLNITNQINTIVKGTYIIKITQNGSGMSLKFVKN